LQGNPGRRPLHPEREPQPKAALPRCPPELSELAQKEWRRISRELHSLGLLTAVDRAALAAYCAAYGDFIAAEAMLRRVRSYVPVVDDQGRTIDVKASGITRMRDKAALLMHRFLLEFGMTPASRSRCRAADIDAAAKQLAEDEAFLSRPFLKLVDPA
jgi:P27 family predicted phage terminase small subunit